MITPIQFYSKIQLQQFLLKFRKTQKDTRIRYLFHLPMFGKIAEIGVAEGNFSECIFHIIRPLELHLIDCWQEQKHNYQNDIYNVSQRKQDIRYQMVQKKFLKYPQVKIHKGYSLEMVKLFPNNYFDWVYLDANHEYNEVKSDLKTWYKKVKFNGIIAGNDYTSKNGFGVIAAVDRFEKKQKMEMFLLDADPWHSWALHNKNNLDRRYLSNRFTSIFIKLKRLFISNYWCDYFYTMVILYLRRKFNFNKI